MIFVIILTVIFGALFIVSLYTINYLKKAKLRASLQKDEKSGSKSSAINTLSRLVEKDHADIASRIQLAKLYMEVNDYSKASKELNSVLSVGQGSPHYNEKEINRLLAECYWNENNLDEAFKTYAILRNIDPQDPYPYIKMGIIEKKAGKKSKAVTYFKKAASLDPANIETYKELGILLYQSKNYQEAFTTLVSAYNKSPENSEINYYLGKTRVYFNDQKNAFQNFLKSKNDPLFTVDSLLHLGTILRNYSKMNEARKVLTTAFKLKKLDRDKMLAIRYELGEVCLSQNDVQGAIEQWEKILDHVSSYKDVETKLKRYEQAKTNNALRAYMMSSRADFIEICKKTVMGLADNVNIIRVEPQKDSSVDIFAQMDRNGTNQTILFKFVQGTYTVGQLSVREFYEKVKDTKANLGICYSTAGYSDDAFSFTEGRALELYGKNGLLKLLAISIQ
ncbi:MAG: tetratricopeptide repeat protein [Spirochaetota bacterium]